MKKAILWGMGCMVFWVATPALAAGCNRHEVCPPICVADDSAACTDITNTSQACVLRQYTCNGCVSAAALRLNTSVACVACVVDALAATGEAAASGCSARCGDAAMVQTVVEKNGC